MPPSDERAVEPTVNFNWADRYKPRDRLPEGTTWESMWEGDDARRQDRAEPHHGVEHDLVADGAHPWGLGALKDECAKVAATAEGSRNQTLNSAAYRMGQVVGGGSIRLVDAREALAQAGRACGLPEAEISLVLRLGPDGALQQGQLSPRFPPTSTSAPVVTVLAGESASDTGAARLATEQLDREFLDRDELRNLPTPEPLIEMVLPRGAYGIIRGRDQSFKSFVALDWALCLATGRPWQGHRCEKVGVLYIAGEGAYGLDKRVAAWESANSTTVTAESFIVRKSAMSMFKPNASFAHLLERVDVDTYGLVVVDTLVSCAISELT
jgi:hypothetical protein